ncbi:endopeptidase La [Patescibacteria group bacterium]|nr:endopeptidase La [Patescibacteria group bacterium]
MTDFSQSSDNKDRSPEENGAQKDPKTAVEPSSVASPVQESKKTEVLTLPVVPIREGVLFPNTESVLTFGRVISVEAVNQAKRANNMVVLLSQREPNTDIPNQDQMYEVGTLAVVERTLSTEGQLNALVRGTGRVRVLKFVTNRPYILAEVEKLDDISQDDEEAKALSAHLQKEFKRAVQMGKPVEFLNFMKLMSGMNDGELVDQIASTLTLDTEEKQKILETLNIKRRLKQVIDHLAKEMKVLEIEKDVASKTQQKFDKSMRENVLRERVKVIQKELGEIDDEEEILTEYEQKLKKLKLPAEAKQKIVKEMRRLKQMSVNNPEGGYLRTWLDTVLELPWGKSSKGNVELDKAQKVLDKNHYGLKEVKDRIVEYIAVLQLKQKNTQDSRLPTILCFVGAPGVGKTSIGKSIAESLGRKFVKVSLGGVRDEAEIRGHRRTYVGAMPGKIINGMKQAKTMNPVFMLDEIDKLSFDYRGDPSAALLEALDPEQNGGFEDHYLDMPFDLSDVIFITTANTLETIPPALRDRLEIIRYSGYTEEEKFFIAKQHLLDKVRKGNGLKPTQVSLGDKELKMIISRYTREAGVRNLEREINKIMRKAARSIAEGKKKKVTVNPTLIKEYLGPEQFDRNLAEKDDEVGLATGLAWTSVGGEVLFVEVALTKGKGMIKLTGKLGEVMKESAQAALTYVHAHAKELGIKQDVLDKTNVHIHIPEGAVPKDGPSAGVTLTTAIVSAYTNRRVRKDVAMTGEVTLRGKVMRIGGLKEKSIAAHQAGVSTVIIPFENERDLVEIPDTVKKGLTFKPVKHVDEVLNIALR